MKKLLLAVVLPLAATSVYAETSVTLYGGALGGITVQKLKGKSATVRFANGSLDTNMFGFTGTEDLGSGNNVFLRLEQGYVLSNGKEDDDKGDKAFNRQAYLGFESSHSHLYSCLSWNCRFSLGNCRSLSHLQK